MGNQWLFFIFSNDRMIWGRSSYTNSYVFGLKFSICNFRFHVDSKQGFRFIHFSTHTWFEFEQHWYIIVVILIHYSFHHNQDFDNWLGNLIKGLGKRTRKTFIQPSSSHPWILGVYKGIILTLDLLEGVMGFWLLFLFQVNAFVYNTKCGNMVNIRMDKLRGPFKNWIK